MRHLEHVGAEVSTLRQQRLLCLDLGVCGQQHPPATDLDTDHQRRVVRI
jgi:hypothetical protein